MCSEKLTERSKRHEEKMEGDSITKHLRNTWEMNQEVLKKKMILHDTEEWQKCRKISTSPTSIVDENPTKIGKKVKKSKQKGQNETSCEHCTLTSDASNSESFSVILKKTHNLQISETKENYFLTHENCSLPADNSSLKYVAGVDISYVKDDKEKACAALVVLCLPCFQVVYEDIKLINISVPYIPGFLAFREVDFIVDMVRKLKLHSYPYFPQVILVDGNGILHPRGFGAACHLGVLLDIPTVGAAKNLYSFNGLPSPHEIKSNEILQTVGDSLPLKISSGEVLGAALKTSQSAKNPIYVSPGHRCSLDTALWLIQVCSRYRIPEPIRQADIRSREYLRVNGI